MEEAGGGVEPKIIITRPLAQAEAFAAALISAHGGPLPILIAPLMEIVPVDPELPIGAPEHVIFTSANAVGQAVHLLPQMSAMAWCVGPQTAAAAAKAGFAVRDAKGDANALTQLILDERPPGLFLHLRGEHATGRVAERLQNAGLPCEDVVVYRQDPVPVPSDLRAALTAPAPLIVPLFSPRSARLLLQAGPITAPAKLICISPAVAEILKTNVATDVILSNFPDKSGMIAATLAAFTADCGGKTP